MRGPMYCLAGLAVVAGLLLPAVCAGADTAALQMKRVDPSARAGPEGLPADYLFRMTRPQTIFQQLGGREGAVRMAEQADAPAFAELVKKEPAEYAAATPFRGVVKLGSHYYPFVLDAAPPQEEEGEQEEPQAEKKDGEKGGLLSTLGRALAAPLAGRPEAEGQAPVFTRLYFDRNRNGDLTDDGVVEAESAQAFSASTSRAAFPVVELTLEVDGKKVEYAFILNVQVNSAGNFAYAYASLNAAAYREGEIELDGRKRRIVLVDFNSNGRFDDVFQVEEDAQRGSAQPVIGDMLFIDPQPAVRYRSPYDPTTSDDQFQVGKLIAIDNRFYELDIHPSGETLSLAPSSLPTGYAANANPGARAIVYGEQSMLEIAVGEDGKAVLPEGTWRLMSYTILHPEPEPEPQDDDAQPPRAAMRPTLVSAQAGSDMKPFRIADGKTTNMAFGPPFTPQVTASVSPRAPGTLSLQMSLMGAGGERCSSMIINGGRPPQPEFTIHTMDGEEVASGKFSYG